MIHSPSWWVLEVAGPGVGQGLVRPEGVAAPVADEQAGRGVPHGRVEEERHAVDGPHQLLEAEEVDLEVVVDRHAEGLLDRADQRLLPAGREGRVDLALARAGDVDVEVAGEAQQLGLGRVGVDPQQHDRVRQDPEVLAPVGDRVVRVQAVGAVGADQQVVLGRVAVRLLVQGVAELEAGDLAEAEVEDAEAADGREQADDEGHVEGDRQAGSQAASTSRVTGTPDGNDARQPWSPAPRRRPCRRL